MANNDKNDKNDKIRSIIYILMIILATVGLVGGIGWTTMVALHHGEAMQGEAAAALPAFGLLVTAFMVWPVIKEMVRRM